MSKWSLYLSLTSTCIEGKICLSFNIYTHTNDNEIFGGGGLNSIDVWRSNISKMCKSAELFHTLELTSVTSTILYHGVGRHYM